MSILSMGESMDGQSCGIRYQVSCNLGDKIQVQGVTSPNSGKSERTNKTRL